jgi:hypothetical protein
MPLGRTFPPHSPYPRVRRAPFEGKSADRERGGAGLVFTIFLFRVTTGAIIVFFGTLVSTMGVSSVVPVMWIESKLLTNVPLGRAFRLYGYGLMTGRHMWR